MTTQPSEFDSLAQAAVDTNTHGERLQELAQVSQELARLVANNPATPPQLLQKLSKSQDTITIQNVTANPNTPTEVLLSLGYKFPGEFLNNPIFSLLLLANINFINEIPEHTLKSLLYYELNNLSLTDEYRGETNNFFLVQVANSNKSELRQILAIHRNTPIAVLEILARDEDFSVRYGVARHLNTPVSTLEILARDKEVCIRSSVARHPNTSVVILELLTQDENQYVRSCLADNRNTSVAILELLARD